MLIKSQLITQMSGSIGGVTGSHNRFGMYLRSRATPVNPSTIYQSIVRAAVATLANRWIDVLTPAQRSGWETYAANVSMTGALGAEIYLTGLNHYVRSNANRLQASVVTQDDAPGIFNLGEFTLPSITASEATQQVTFSFTDTDDWANEVGGYGYIFDSRPQNPTRSYFKGPYRMAHVLAGAAVPPVSPHIHAAVFAFVEGQRLYSKFSSARADGRLASHAVVNCIVAA